MARRFARSQSGTALVEFAIILPFLALLLIGVVEIGRYMYFGVLVAHAAEAGAQYGAQSLSNAYSSSGITAAVNADSPNVTWTGITPATVCYESSETVTCPAGTPSPGMIEYVKVKVVGTFNSLLNYPGVPTQATVTAATTMRVLGQ